MFSGSDLGRWAQRQLAVSELYLSVDGLDLKEFLVLFQTS